MTRPHAKDHKGPRQHHKLHRGPGQSPEPSERIRPCPHLAREVLAGGDHVRVRVGVGPYKGDFRGVSTGTTSPGQKSQSPFKQRGVLFLSSSSSYCRTGGSRNDYFFSGLCPTLTIHYNLPQTQSPLASFSCKVVCKGKLSQTHSTGSGKLNVLAANSSNSSPSCVSLGNSKRFQLLEQSVERYPTQDPGQGCGLCLHLDLRAGFEWVRKLGRLRTVWIYTWSGCISVFSTYMMAHAHLHAKVPCLLGQGPATTTFCALAQLLILQLRTHVAKDVGALLRLTI